MTEISEVGDIKTGGEYLYSLSVKGTQVFTINFQFPILANQNSLLTSCTQDIHRKYWLILNWISSHDEKDTSYNSSTHVMITRKRHKSKNRRYIQKYWHWSSLALACFDHPWLLNADMQIQKKKKYPLCCGVFIYLWSLAKRNTWRRLWEIAARDR